MFPRKIRKIIRKVRFNRFKRSRFYRPTRRARIMRSVLRRRPHIPEVKYIDLSTSATEINGDSAISFKISPNSLTVGAGQGSRIANEVNLRRVVINLGIEAPQWSISLETAPTLTTNSDYIRVILWTPRVTSEKATEYMNTMNLYSHIDWNVVTIVKDFRLRLSPRYVPDDITSVSAGGSYTASTTLPNFVLKHMSIPFPRKAKFAPTGISNLNDLDPDKDVLYCTIWNDFADAGELPGAVDTRYRFDSRLTYTDS